jgi:hypothetical protein
MNNITKTFRNGMTKAVKFYKENDQIIKRSLWYSALIPTIVLSGNILYWIGRNILSLSNEIILRYFSRNMNGNPWGDYYNISAFKTSKNSYYHFYSCSTIAFWSNQWIRINLGVNEHLNLYLDFLYCKNIKKKKEFYFKKNNVFYSFFSFIHFK